MNLQVWVGCLAHYNDGALIGDWVDAAEAPEWKCPRANPNDIYITCEETWCFDHEIPWVSGELDPVTAGKWAEALEWVPDYYEKAVTAWLKHIGADSPDAATEDAFTEAYQGEYDSPRDHAYDILSDWETDREAQWRDMRKRLGDTIPDDMDAFFVPPYFSRTFNETDWDSDFSYVDGFVFRD